MILGVTGHRPKYLPGQYSNYTYQILLKISNGIIKKYQPEIIISGFALGFDIAMAEAAINNNISVVAAIPFVGQEKHWTKSQQTKYHRLLEKSEKVIVSEGGYSAAKMIIRNQFIVNFSDEMFCLWNGDEKTGTGNAVTLAMKQGKNVKNLWNAFNQLYDNLGQHKQFNET